ncbi:hypothetical protein GCM10009426_32500 [Rheinheimera tangshanensis]|nr:hypothetical protein GCM10010920_13030 [Rheinheimera tangshanensis]
MSMKFKQLIIGSKLIEAVGENLQGYVWGRDSRYLDSLFLTFDTGILKIYNPACLLCDSGQSVGLGSIIGLVVTDSFVFSDELTLVLDHKILVRVSLREEDCIGPEAAVFQAVSGDIVVFN